MSKKNKSLIALLLVLCVGLVGLTIAYFSNSTEIENEFITKEYGTTYTEDFVSPSNWLPGDTTDKIVTVTNSGQVDEAVRISLSETWTPNNANATLNGWIHADGTKSNHTTENELSTDVRAAIINFVNPSDWTKVGDYYYYNYRLQPGETTDSLIESVTFNALTKLGDTCTPSTSNGVTTITCNSSGSDYDHATYKLTINVETVQYNQYASAWNTNVAILEEKPAPVVQQTGAEYLASSATNAVDAEYNDSTKGNMFTFSHTVNGKTVNESRYIGDEPNNYVYFNCDEPQEGVEYNYASSCEVWRILGVFSVDDGQGHTEQRMKLVRGSAFANNMYWNNGSYNNDWTYTYASLKNFLNGDYYNASGDATTYGLKESARNMIGDAVYNLGAFDWSDTLTTEQLYTNERGTTTCGACNSDTTKLTWTGKVALMYPSDNYMVYGNGVNSACYNTPAIYYNCNSTNASTGWVYNSNIREGQSSPDYTWLLSPNSGNTYSAFNVNSDSALAAGSLVYTVTRAVRPVVYLKSNIKIDGGNGESTNPYKLGL